MAATGRNLTIRHYFVDPKSGQVLRASNALLGGIIARRRHIPDWAGMKIHTVQVIAAVSGSRIRIAEIQGHYTYFEDGGYWDQPREAEVARAFMELASCGETADGHRHHSRRFAKRRAAANRWLVEGEIFAAIQGDVEGGAGSARIAGKAPWKWAPPSAGVAGRD